MSKVQKSLIESIDEIGQAHNAEVYDSFGDDPVYVVYAVYVMEPDSFLTVRGDAGQLGVVDDGQWGVVDEDGEFMLFNGEIARFFEAEAERAAAWIRSQEIVAWAAKIGGSFDHTD